MSTRRDRAGNIAICGIGAGIFGASWGVWGTIIGLIAGPVLYLIADYIDRMVKRP